MATDTTQADPRTGNIGFYDPSSGSGPLIGQKVLYNVGGQIQAIDWTGDTPQGVGQAVSKTNALSFLNNTLATGLSGKADGSGYGHGNGAYGPDVQKSINDLTAETGNYSSAVGANFLKFNPNAGDLSQNSFDAAGKATFVSPSQGITPTLTQPQLDAQDKANGIAPNLPFQGAPPSVNTGTATAGTGLPGGTNALGTHILTQAELDAQNASRGISQYNPPAAVTSAGLADSPTLPYTSTGTGTNNNVGGTLNGMTTAAATSAANAKAFADEAAKLGPKDQAISDLIKSTLALNDTEANKSSDQTAANTAAGVDVATKTVTDLETLQQQQLAAAITHQNALQTGQGVTTAIDSRQRAESLRLDTIAAANTSSLMAAAKGNLATAQALADKAIALKYGPVEDKIKAAMANLTLLKNDPATTQEEKAKADTMQSILDQQKANMDASKATETEVSKVATTAASYLNNFVATSQYPTAAQALLAIKNASDPVTAQTIATQTGMTAPTVKTGTWSNPYSLSSGDVVQKNDVTGEIRTVDAASAASAAGTWSAPYAYQGNTVQKNTKTGEIKVVGNATSQDTTNTANNILNGVSSFSDVPTTDPNYENVKSTLQQHGLYDATPPAWYVSAINAKSNSSQTPASIQSQWTAYTKKALGN